MRSASQEFTGHCLALTLLGSYLTDAYDGDIRCREGKPKQLIHEMYPAPTCKAALAAYDQFISSYQTKFPKACECLEKDKEVLFTFYDFPPQHWPHLRTTNPIESTFAYHPTANSPNQGFRFTNRDTDHGF